MKDAIRVQGIDKSSTPKVSVIVPNYNHARFLRQRLDSILHQTFQDFELILLDDCSMDDSRTVLSEYGRDPRVKMQFNEANSGSTFKQWNKGVRLARGEYVWIAESDDYAEDRLLEKLVSRLDTNSSIVLCNSRSWRVTEEGEVIGYLDSPLAQGTKKWTQDFCSDGREECEKYLVRCCTVLNASSVLFRKDIFYEVGGADETMRMCADWKLWSAMALRGKVAYVGGTPLNYYREHNGSATTRNQQTGIYAAEYLEVVRWIMERVNPSADIRTQLCSDLFPLWSAKLLTNQVPLTRRWAILRNARALDRRAFRKMFWPSLLALRLMLSRRWRSFRSRSSASSGFGKGN